MSAQSCSHSQRRRQLHVCVANNYICRHVSAQPTTKQILFFTNGISQRKRKNLHAVLACSHGAQAELFDHKTVMTFWVFLQYSNSKKCNWCYLLFTSGKRFKDFTTHTVQKRQFQSVVSKLFYHLMIDRWKTFSKKRVMSIN